MTDLRISPVHCTLEAWQGFDFCYPAFQWAIGSYPRTTGGGRASRWAHRQRSTMLPRSLWGQDLSQKRAPPLQTWAADAERLL